MVREREREREGGRVDIYAHRLCSRAILSILAKHSVVHVWGGRVGGIVHVWGGVLAYDCLGMAPGISLHPSAYPINDGFPIRIPISFIFSAYPLGATGYA